MDIILIVIGSVMALAGVWLVIDFLIWEQTGTKAVARIEGFQAKTSLWLRLPVVAFEDEHNKTITLRPARIDQMIYYVVNPNVGDITTIIYRADPNGPVGRVYGYIRLSVGVMLFVPLVLALGVMAGNSMVMSQVLYMVSFVAMVAGALAFLKFIQKT